MQQIVFEGSSLSAFCMELHLIVRAGIPFQEGIALLLEEEQNQTKKQTMETLYRYLEQGDTLADAFRKTEAFPHYAVEMIAIGQSTGHLERVFYALANYYERMTQIRQSVHNIIWYPMILMVTMLFVVLVLLVYVMPIFADVFAQLGAALSPVVQLMLSLGQWLGQNGLYIVLAAAVVLLGLFVLYKTGNRKAIWKSMLKRMTANWQASRLLAASKLADALVLTLSSGMNLDEALDLAGTLTEDAQMQEKIAVCKKAMLIEGVPFADAAMEQQLFAPMYCRMLAVGFRTGDVDGVMAEVARRIADDADHAMDTLLNRIEPVLVIGLSVLVGLILLSVMLPLMGIMTAIG